VHCNFVIFIRLAAVASQICEITRNSENIRTYIRKLICNFLLVINSNFGRILYRFRDIEE